MRTRQTEVQTYQYIRLSTCIFYLPLTVRKVCIILAKTLVDRSWNGVATNMMKHVASKLNDIDEIDTDEYADDFDSTVYKYTICVIINVAQSLALTTPLPNLTWKKKLHWHCTSGWC